MSLITAKGAQAKENAQKGNVDIKDIYLRLKDGESHLVRLLGPEDYVEYQAVGDYNNGIFNQPISGPESPLVIAHEKGSKAFEKLYTKARYVFVFASLETGKLVAFDASKGQAKALISTIEEYTEEGEHKEFAFNFKRMGEKTDTTYSLNPKMRMKKDEKEAFDEFDGKEVTIEYFESIIQPKTDKFLVKLLAEIDPTVVELFPDIDISEDEDEEADGSEPIDNTDEDEDLPF